MSTLIASDTLFHLMRAIGWTLVHSLWQAAIAALLALVVLWATGKSKPATRYNILLILFIALIGFVFVTFFNEYQQPAVQSLEPTADLQSNGPTTRNDDIYLLTNQTQGYFSAIEQWINGHIAFIVVGWLLACCVQIFRLLHGAAHVRGLRASGTLLPGEWNDRLEKLREKLSLNYPVAALESARVKVPVVAGFLKPFILVPVGMLSNIPPDQVESILLHELAHIRRKDHLVNALQVAAESVLFFNPALMWISALIREEREACCDAIAVKELNSSSRYVEALVTFQTYSGSVGRASLAFAGNKNYLLKRVKRILYNENKKINVMEKIILFAGLAAVCMGPVFFKATAKSAIVAPTAIVVQTVDTLPPAKEENDKKKSATERRAAKRAERAAKLAGKRAAEAERQAIEAEKEAVKAKAAAEAYKPDARENVEPNTDVDVEVDEIRAPEIKLQIDKAMQEAAKSMQQSKIALRQMNYQLQQAKLQEFNMQNMKRQMELVNDQMQRLNFQKGVLLNNNELNGIISFLIQKNIIKSSENLSFRLDNDELIVNDVKQSESLHSELKERYISNSGDFYEYKNSGGSTSIGIRHND